MFLKKITPAVLTLAITGKFFFFLNTRIKLSVRLCLGTGIKLRPLIASIVFLRVYIMPGVERVARRCVRVSVIIIIIIKKEYNIHIIIIIILEFPFSGLGTGYGRLPSDYNVAIVSPVWRRRPRRYRRPRTRRFPKRILYTLVGCCVMYCRRHFGVFPRDRRRQSACSALFFSTRCCCFKKKKKYFFILLMSTPEPTW